jgi:hypothetical protein
MTVAGDVSKSLKEGGRGMPRAASRGWLPKRIVVKPAGMWRRASTPLPASSVERIRVGRWIGFSFFWAAPGSGKYELANAKIALERGCWEEEAMEAAAERTES